MDKIHKFTETLKDIKNRHKNLEYNIADGLKKINDPLIDYSIINNVLDVFLSRIGIRTLISHQIESLENKSVINYCNVNNILYDVIKEINYISNRYCDYDHYKCKWK